MPASVVTISEFSGVSTQLEGTQVVPMPVLADQTVAATAGVSTNSNPLGPNTRLIRIHAKVNACIAVGTQAAPPTATVNNLAYSANQTEYMRVQPGAVIAVIGDP